MGQSGVPPEARRSCVIPMTAITPTSISVRGYPALTHHSDVYLIEGKE